VKTLAFLLAINLSGCSSVRWPDDVGVSIEDLEGFGNPEVFECQITFNGEAPIVPCVIEVTVTWQI
jgi:hypothetical protein